MDYKSAWRERTRTWALNLLGDQCSLCGTRTDALDFDHIDPSTKLFEISAGIRDGYGRARLLVELSKCQLLCSKCHIEKSVDFLDGRHVPHGGGKSGKKDCKCLPCKARKREYMQEFHKKRKSL